MIYNDMYYVRDILISDALTIIILDVYYSYDDNVTFV